MASRFDGLAARSRRTGVGSGARVVREVAERRHDA